MPSSVYLHDGEHQITVRFRTEADRERFKAHYRAIDAFAVRFRAENDRLRAALAFAASCIKAGEPWTPKCEEVIGGALRGVVPTTGPLTHRDTGDESDAREKGGG